MGVWTGVALARTPPGSDGMHSRVSTYLHPVAGRPLAWHTLSALASLHPSAESLLFVGGAELSLDLFGEVGPAFEFHPSDDTSPELADGSVLVVDAAAPAIGAALAGLLHEPPGSCLAGPDGSAAALWLTRDDAADLLRSGEELGVFAARCDGVRHLVAVPEAIVVRDRVALARASHLIRDRIVARHMAHGVTFLLPDSVLLDVDVEIGRDAIVYPGVILEGQTRIGEETVLGPGCRVIDSWIGSGVELKGWNFISRASVRNRAILEPYVRRGFD